MKKLFFSLCAVLLSIGTLAAQGSTSGDPSPIIKHLTETICEGHPYVWGNRTLSAEGVYRDTSTSFPEMRDSITILTLHVKPASYTRISDVIEYGESYIFGDTTLTSEGVYSRRLPAANGCDSIIYLQLGVLFPPCDTVRAVVRGEICEGDRFFFCGRRLTEAGIYTDTIRRADDSCDSIVTLTLHVRPNSEIALDTTIFTDESLTITARLTDTTFHHSLVGDYEHTVYSTNQYGCDSVISITLHTIKREIPQIIPTMFSPYDGIKEVFLRNRGLELYIYDRYGLLIRHCETDEGWDGRYKGELVDPGIYIYVAKDEDGRVRKGTIEVIKED